MSREETAAQGGQQAAPLAADPGPAHPQRLGSTRSTGSGRVTAVLGRIVVMLFVAFMDVMVAFYLGRTRKAQGGELPEDVLTADIDDGDPELGEFSPWSWWPVVLAGSATVFLMGLAVGTFMLPIGLALFVVAIVGWVYEYYRGNFAR